MAYLNSTKMMGKILGDLLGYFADFSVWYIRFFSILTYPTVFYYIGYLFAYFFMFSNFFRAK